MTTSRVSKSEVNAAIGAEIRSFRALRKMSQRDVFEKAKLSEATYVRLEAGTRDITIEYLAAICKALGVLPSELVQSAERRPENREAFRVTRINRAGAGVLRSLGADQPQPD